MNDLADDQVLRSSMLLMIRFIITFPLFFTSIGLSPPLPPPPGQRRMPTWEACFSMVFSENARGQFYLLLSRCIRFHTGPGSSEPQALGPHVSGLKSYGQNGVFIKAEYQRHSQCKGFTAFSRWYQHSRFYFSRDT